MVTKSQEEYVHLKIYSKIIIDLGKFIEMESRLEVTRELGEGGGAIYC